MDCLSMHHSLKKLTYYLFNTSIQSSKLKNYFGRILSQQHFHLICGIGDSVLMILVF